MHLSKSSFIPKWIAIGGLGAVPGKTMEISVDETVAKMVKVFGTPSRASPDTRARAALLENDVTAWL